MHRERVTDGDAVNGNTLFRRLLEPPSVNESAIGLVFEGDATFDGCTRQRVLTDSEHSDDFVFRPCADPFFEMSRDAWREPVAKVNRNGQADGAFGIRLDHSRQVSAARLRQRIALRLQNQPRLVGRLRKIFLGPTIEVNEARARQCLGSAYFPPASLERWVCVPWRLAEVPGIRWQARGIVAGFNRTTLI